MAELNITDDLGDAVVRLADVKAALERLKGKTVTVTMTRAQYEAFVAQHPGANRGRSFDESIRDQD